LWRAMPIRIKANLETSLRVVSRIVGGASNAKNSPAPAITPQVATQVLSCLRYTARLRPHSAVRTSPAVQYTSRAKRSRPIACFSERRPSGSGWASTLPHGRGSDGAVAALTERSRASLLRRAELLMPDPCLVQAEPAVEP